MGWSGNRKLRFEKLVIRASNNQQSKGGFIYWLYPRSRSAHLLFGLVLMEDENYVDCKVEKEDKTI